MARQTQKTTANKTAAKKTNGKKSNGNARIIAGFVCLFLSVFLLLGFFIDNGWFLKLLRDFFKGLVGLSYYIMPFTLLLSTWFFFTHGKVAIAKRIVAFNLSPILFSGLVHIIIAKDIAVGGLYAGGIAGTTGGLISGLLSMGLSAIFSSVGAFIVLLLTLIFFVMIGFNITISSLVQAIENRPRPVETTPKEPVDRAAILVNKVANKHIERVERREQRRTSDFDLPVDEPPLIGEKTAPKVEIVEKPKTESFVERVLSSTKDKKDKAPQIPEPAPAEPVPEEPPLPEPAIPVAQPVDLPVASDPIPVELPPLEKPPTKLKKEDTQASAQEITKEIEMTVPVAGEYLHPPVSLLKTNRNGVVDGTSEMRENTERLNGTLQSFGISAHIVNVTRGPSVTRYELELERGVKLSKLTNLADDIALSLGATGVRISAIPDKISVVGIEVPNRLVATVSAKDVLDSSEFRGSKSKISFAIGKDIGGNRIIGDIARLPHLLIAGTTGSGKSVCMNSLIISLLFKAKPEEVRLIMIDPKMVELGIYNGIPHLLIPVVTDPKKAAGALQWAVTEMLRRYRMMADAGVRDLDTYNKQVVMTEDERNPMEQVVVVIDELADLMLVAAKEVEESICRIAQMGRASGIHLVIATQRPSADVITGLMKANIPSRIAFAVASAMESRIILDTQGAEKLVGKGDMLYAPLGQGKPKRVQGCFITDEEVQEVVNFIKTTTTPNYSEDVAAQIELSAEKGSKSEPSGSVNTASGDGDELLHAAVDVFMELGQGSVSVLQRRLKLGYARAARIVDEMEDKGFIGPFEGSKPRQLLITKDQWQVLKNGGVITDNPAVEEEIDEQRS